MYRRLLLALKKPLEAGATEARVRKAEVKVICIDRQGEYVERKRALPSVGI